MPAARVDRCSRDFRAGSIEFDRSGVKFVQGEAIAATAECVGEYDVRASGQIGIVDAQGVLRSRVRGCRHW